MYVLGRDRCHLFLADDQGLEHFELGPDFELEGAARGLEGLHEDSLDHGRVHTGLARSIALARDAFLPADVRARLSDWKGVAIVGIDSFGFLPFELLPLEGVPLGTSHELRYVPSLPVAEALARRRGERAAAPGELLLVAAPHAGVEPELREHFPFSSSERRRLTDPYADVLLLEGDEATTEGFLALDPARWRVGHWVVHGQYDPTRARPAGLRLSGSQGPEVLWASEMAERGRDFPDLSLFSTCSAGRAPLRRGDDGVAQLGSLALSRGASSVVVPRGQVGLAPSIELFADFHRRVRGGERPVAALRAARKQAYARASELERLHFAALHLVGLGDRALFDAAPPASPRRWWATLGVLALVFGVGLGSRRWRRQPVTR